MVQQNPAPVNRQQRRQHQQHQQHQSGKNDKDDKINSEYRKIAEQWAKAAREADEALDGSGAGAESTLALESPGLEEAQKSARERRLASAFVRRCWWTVGFWAWLLAVHLTGLYLFTSGFLLTRLVLDETSSCGAPPPLPGAGLLAHPVGDPARGCWHPRSFDRAVVVVVDALRYDFAAPRPAGVERRLFHDAMPFMYETAATQPSHAVLRPFIADPPTTTLQRLKGLTTGTLPTFVDMGRNFAGTAIDEDNLLSQLRALGRRIGHIGDDTWWALFPGHFEEAISRPYDSFNVWDLDTVDNGVIEHLPPLLRPNRTADWDLLIGHCLGVDHAGHRYGPDHPAMAAKLGQMDRFIRRLAGAIDDDTLLVVMGDHGMDAKGDHGGESDDEVEAALWMYSRRPFFGRTSAEAALPPATAKTRPVGQTDLVPTLALLLGIPIPYNSLGRPIEEAFAGVAGHDWANLAAASRLAAAGVRRYQQSYFAARGIVQSDAPGSPTQLWAAAAAAGAEGEGESAAADSEVAYAALVRFQDETLRVFRGLWARFDVPRMLTGIAVMAAGVAVMLVYAARDDVEDGWLEAAEKVSTDGAAQRGEQQQQQQQPHPLLPYQTQHRRLVTAAAAGAAPILFVGAAAAVVVAGAEWWQWLDYAAAASALASAASVAAAALNRAKARSLIPRTAWGWLAIIFPVAQSVGFGSNSYTIWEDTISLFFIATFGLVAFAAAFRLPSAGQARTLAAYHAVAFVALARVASLSRLCREEQIPHCVSTYYASSGSSTSAPWQLVIPFAVAAALPAVVRSFLAGSRSYHGPAPTWVGIFFRLSLLMAAGYWVLDAAEALGPDRALLRPGLVRSLAVWLARAALAIAVVGGTSAFAHAGPCVGVEIGPPPGRAVTALGFGNAHGARYLLLPLSLAAGCILVSKPMGGGALGLMVWQVLTLAELVHLLGLQTHPIGPVMLALLGNFYFFRTGHQAVLSTVQWDSAFVALHEVRYPWSPLLVLLNTLAGQLLAVACAPLLALWRTGPRRRGTLEQVARRGLAPLAAYYAVETVATMACAGWLRRHLMLYRVFAPRFMMAAVVLVAVDVAAIVVGLGGVRANVFGVSEVFGWRD